MTRYPGWEDVTMPPKFEITKAEEESIASIRERLAKSSPGPCRLSMYDPDRDPVELFRENLSHGSGNVWAVGLPEHPFSVGGWEDRPGHLVITCVTGNGPTSEANAVFYANARADIEALLSRLEDAERERDRRRDILLSAVTAAKNATLPPGFIWGNDAMEQFNFGKERAAEAVAEAIEAADRAAKECE